MQLRHFTLIEPLEMCVSTQRAYVLGNNFISRREEMHEKFRNRVAAAIYNSPTTQSGYFQRKCVSRRSSSSIGAGHALFYLSRYCYFWREDRIRTEREEREKKDLFSTRKISLTDREICPRPWIRSLCTCI